jgi:hypothetical protein
MKIKLSILTKQAKKAVADNSPAILTALGVTGTLTVAYLTGKASFRAAEILAKETAQREVDGDPEMDNWDKADLVWREFIPAAGLAAMTVSAIIGANHISTKRVAAFASAYSMAEKGFAQYKDKVLEKVGPKKEGEIRTEVAQDQVHKPHTIVLTDKGEHICFDLWTNREFLSDIERVRSAVNDINFQIINEGYASLSDFWALIGLDSTAESDDIGWNTDKKLEVDFDSVLTKDGKPCMTIGFKTLPRPRFYNAY